MMEGTSNGGGDDAYTSNGFECPVCKMSFPEEWKLTAHHFSEHEQARWDIDGQRQEPQFPVWKGYECNFCHRLFDKLQELQRHYERRRQMIEKRNLTRLAQLHSSIDKKKGLRFGVISICKICDKIFANSSNLRRHNKRFHLESASGFKCDLCSSAPFPTGFQLERHRMETTHAAPPKLYMCIFCDKNLSEASKLLIHIKRHIGERSYVCSECDASFVRGCDLRLHQRRIHHGGNRLGSSPDTLQNKITGDMQKFGLSLSSLCQVNLVRCDPQVPEGQRHLLLQRS